MVTWIVILYVWKITLKEKNYKCSPPKENLLPKQNRSLLRLFCLDKHKLCSQPLQFVEKRLFQAWIPFWNPSIPWKARIKDTKSQLKGFGQYQCALCCMFTLVLLNSRLGRTSCGLRILAESREVASWWSREVSRNLGSKMRIHLTIYWKAITIFIYSIFSMAVPYKFIDIICH